MNKPLVLAAAVVGVIFLVLACVYWFVPAGSLPNFMPGFAVGSPHLYVQHGLVALVLALGLPGFAWAKREGSSIGASRAKPRGGGRQLPWETSPARVYG